MNIDLNKFTKEELLSMINDGLDHAKEQRLEIERLHFIIKEVRETLKINIKEHNYEGASIGALGILDKVEENSK